MKKFHCKQEPFADFCDKFSPASGRGAMAWQEHYVDNKSDEIELPPIVYDLVDCLPLDKAMLQSGDYACQGDRYVWKCKNDPQGKMCNKFKPDSEEGYPYWDLIEGFPNPETDFEEVFVEPSRDALMNLVNRVPTEPDYEKYLAPILLEMSLEQFWDCFYANNAMYYISDI